MASQAAKKSKFPSKEQLGKLYSKEEAVVLGDQVRANKTTAKEAGKLLLKKVVPRPSGIKRHDFVFSNLMVFYAIEPWCTKSQEKGQRISMGRRGIPTSKEGELADEEQGDVDPIGAFWQTVIDFRVSNEEQYNNISEGMLLMAAVLDEKLVIQPKLEPQLRKVLQVRQQKYKILLIGPTSRQTAHIQAKVGREFDIDYFNKSQRRLSPHDKGRLQSADVIIVWPMYTGHLQTDAVKPYRSKEIKCGRPGITGTVDAIHSWLRAYKLQVGSNGNGTAKPQATSV